MELTLQRHTHTNVSTIGSLYCGDAHICDILEDQSHPKSDPTPFVKIHGKTAIPRGRYQIVVTDSQRFKCKLPLLLNVPEFSGIRIHPGNAPEDTEGCLLPGILDKNKSNWVNHSRNSFFELFAMIRDELDDGHEVWITVQ